MKRFIIFVLLMVVAVTTTKAQNRSINFEQTKVWDEIIKKAKQEKKLIFIDCYTSWCGACIIMAKQTFTQDTVADFFNKNFVNVKYDMEKDADGVMLKHKFNIERFPTLLFINPETEEIVHYMIGSRKAATLIAEGKQAQDPENNFNTLQKRYATGENSVEFMAIYLSTLSATFQEDKAKSIALDYLKTLAPEQCATKAGWKLIKEYETDPLSVILKQVMNERKKFYAIVGKEEVDVKLRTSIQKAVRELTNWTPREGEVFDEERNQELTKYLLNIDFDAAPAGLANLYTATYARKKDFCGLLNKMEEVSNYNLFRGKTGRDYFRRNINVLSLCQDKVLVEESIKRIDAECSRSNDYFYKAELMEHKASLQSGIGDVSGSEKSRKEAAKYAAEWKKRKEKHVIQFEPKY